MIGAMPVISEPPRMNPFLRLGVAISERVVHRRLLPARLLAWYPKAAIGSGVLESLVAHDEPSRRLLTLVRVTASLTVNCAFCVDMNGFEYEMAGISDAEMAALSAHNEGDVASFTPRELVAIDYARHISATPLVFPEELMARVTEAFTEREIVILSTTAAQVNYWARVIQGLGIPPAGFRSDCPVPDDRAER